MKEIIKKPALAILKKIKPFATALFELEAAIAKKWSFYAHKRLFWATWGIMPYPEFFDHHIDLNYFWPKTGSSFWLERGVYGVLALKGGDVLELACGDGFNAKNFYSKLSNSVVACDFDTTAIVMANRKNKAANVKYILADIRTNMPEGSFDNITWDAAIEHFTADEIKGIMADIKKRLKTGGILSGYTLVENKDGKKLEQHETEFNDMAD